MKKKTGVVLGKFLPPHKGYDYLIDCARNYVDRLFIVVSSSKSEPISAELRFKWVKSLYPNDNVLLLQQQLPESNHWDVSRSELLNILHNEKPDYVISFDNYGQKLCKALDAKFISIDIAQKAELVCNSTIHNYPYKNWHHIPEIVRPYYTKRICIFGPESTGKTTLSNKLADYFKTIAVPEFARIYLEQKGCNPNSEDMYLIAKGQAETQDSLIDKANKLIFCDTDPLATLIWNEILFNTVNLNIKSLAQSYNYDLYLLLSPDVPWIEDPIRYTPNSRDQFYDICKKYLNTFNRNYIEISGNWEERFTKSCEAIKNLME